jgi:hypothetical protein
MTARKSALAICALCVAGIAASVAAGGQDESVTAYTIAIHERAVSNVTTATLERNRVYARRDDGSAVLVMWNNYGAEQYAKRIIDLVPDRKTVTICDHIRAMTTVYWGPNKTSSALIPFSGRDYQIAGRDVLLGIPVVKSVRDDLHMRVSRWRAPRLNDFIMREVMEKKAADGSIAATTERFAVSVDVGTPESALFAVPLDYREMSPSQVDNETVMRFFNGKGSLDSDLLERADRLYFKSREFRK